MRTVCNLIAGSATEADSFDVVRAPFDGRELARVGVAGEAEVERAIQSAFAARASLRDWPRHARAAVLQRTADALRQRAEEFARNLALEAGKPLSFARAEVARAAVTFEVAAGEARSFGGDEVPLDLEPRGEGRLGFTLRVPRGVVAAISPFNFPLNLVAHKLAPAFAVGAPVILKPAPQSPLTAFALADLLLENGLPPAALSVVHCPPATAELLVRDERVAVLSFTGSDTVGWRLKSLAGRKAVILELGGNAPCVVDETVAWERALPSIVLASFAYAGQVCVKAQRLLVHRSRFDAFLAAFVSAARALPCGDPLDERTVVGPMIEEKHVERVLAWIGEARAAGATVHCGGTRAGQLVHPTVLTGVPDSAHVWCDEVFGPVAIVEPFDDFSAALERCNASRYGLQAGLFTADLSRALLAARTLEFGGVIVNDTSSFRIDSMPYGGSKHSGLGREGLRSAMEELTEPRIVVLRPAP